MRTTTKNLPRLVGAALILGACASCARPATPTSTAGPSGSACMAAPSKPHKTTPVIAVLAGITTTDQNRTLAAQRAEATARIVSAGFAMQARLLVDVIGGGANDADMAVNTQLDAEGPNTLARNNAAQCKTAAVSHAIAALQQRASTPPLNVLDGLRRLAGHLRGLTSERVSVVLFSSMINATPLLPLNDAPTLRRDPRLLVDDVEHANLLPDCRGWDVYVIGAGRTRTGGINDQQSAQLQAFWSVFFARCGGRIVAYDSALTQFPVTAIKAQFAAETVRVQHERSGSAVTTPRQTVTLTLSDTVLFDNGSATPSPSTEAALHRVLTRINQDPVIGKVHIDGFTDTTPNEQPGGNVGLSQRRAQAVGDWLTAHRMLADGIQVLGLGPADPVADNTTAEGRARNRRVEISFTTAAASP